MTRIDNTINDTVNIMMSSTQECNQTSNNVLSMQQVCSECNMCINEIKNITFDANSYLNQKCMADFKMSADVQQKVKEKFEQSASAINSGFNLGTNTSDATTITSLMINLGTQITMTMNQAVNTANNNVLRGSQYASKCELAVNTMHDITFKTYTHMVQDATMKTAAIATVYHDLDVALKQVAEAANKGLNLNFMAALIAGVIAVIVVFVYGGEQTIRSLITTPTGMVITLVIIYLVVAAGAKLFPFREKKTAAAGNAIHFSCGDDAGCEKTGGAYPSCINKVCQKTPSSEDSFW